MATNGRTAKGKFAPGNQAATGHGRPPRQTERDYLRVVVAACPVDTWKQIVERAVSDALAGDGKAREWLSKWIMPANTTLIDLAAGDELGIDPVEDQKQHLSMLKLLSPW